MKKKGWRYLGITLLFIGFLIIGKNIWESYTITHLGKNAISSMREKGVEEESLGETTYDFNRVKDLSTAAVLNAQKYKDQLHAIGLVSIPEVEMEVAIFSGVSNLNLTVGSGTMKPDQQMGKGNYALAGHNFRDDQKLFSALHRTQKGMKVYLTDLNQVFEYTIRNVEMVDPYRLDVIEDREETMVTLLTCNVDGSERLIVQGELTMQRPYDE